VLTVHQYVPPTDAHDIRTFLGFIGFYRDYIPNFSLVVKPLTRLLKKDFTFRWGESQQQAFGALKKAVTDETCLALPDWEKPFIIQCDASYMGVAGVLCQEYPKGLRPVAFTSRVLSQAEKGYCPTEIECLAVVHCVKEFLPYVEYANFVVETDHAALKSILTMEEPSGRVRLWTMRLMGMNCTIPHRRGRQNAVADALSRAALQANLAEVPERLVDELLPIEDPPMQQHLIFDQEELPARQHACSRCTSARTLADLDLVESDNPPDETWEEWFSALNSTSTPRKKNSSQNSFLQAMIGFVEEPKGLPQNMEEWIEAQEQDENLRKVRRCVVTNKEEEPGAVGRCIINDGGLLVQKNEKGLPLILVPQHLRQSVMITCHDHQLAGHFGVRRTKSKVSQ
jgi:hypothetical protein